MFREMRREKQNLTKVKCEEILNKNTCGVLALTGDDGYPYAVPLSYVYFKGKIFFHCAKTGHKIDAIANCAKASFCVVDKDQIVPEKYTTYYRSAIAFGKARILTDKADVMQALNLLVEKYSPHQAESKNEIEQGMPRVSIIELEIEHLSGKQAKELIHAKGV